MQTFLFGPEVVDVEASVEIEVVEVVEAVL